MADLVDILIEYVQEARILYIEHTKYRNAQKVKPSLSLKNFTNYSSMNSHPVANPWEINLTEPEQYLLWIVN
jgi:hypothetical protein